MTGTTTRRERFLVPFVQEDSDEFADGERRREYAGTRDDAIGHSARSAITGSILVARRAGNHEAHSATSNRVTDSAR
jgi:hypothetical protein